MKLKNLLYLFLIPALSLSLISCDDDDDDIIGTWKYEGVEGYSVKTNDDSLTVAIKRYMVDYDIAGDSDHTLIIDDKTITTRYGEKEEISVNYSFKDGKITLAYANMTYTTSFNISGNTAILSNSNLDYFYDEDDIDEDEINYLIHLYPETMKHLVDSDWSKLKITEVIAFQKYTKQ